MLKGTFMIRLIKFTLLTGWVVFVSLSAQIYYSPDTFLQSNLVNDCMIEAKKKKNIDQSKYVHTYIYSTGGYYQVLLEKAYFPQDSILCNFDRRGKIKFIH